MGSGSETQKIIIDLLGKRFGVTLDEGLSAEQHALALAWRRTFEEHFHQILEWELLLHPAGASYMKRWIAGKTPPLIGTIVFQMMQSQMRKQLHARGLGRHSPEIIEAKGRSDVHAFSRFLGDRQFLLSDRPVTADAAVFGLLSPMVYWPMETPVAQYARSLANVKGYCDRIKERCFDGMSGAGL